MWGHQRYSLRIKVSPNFSKIEFYEARGVQGDMRRGSVAGISILVQPIVLLGCGVMVPFCCCDDGCGCNSYNPKLWLAVGELVPHPPCSPVRADVLLNWPLGSKSLVCLGCSARYMTHEWDKHWCINSIGVMPGLVHMGLVGYTPRGCKLGCSLIKQAS